MGLVPHQFRFTALAGPYSFDPQAFPAFNRLNLAQSSSYSCTYSKTHTRHRPLHDIHIHLAQTCPHSGYCRQPVSDHHAYYTSAAQSSSRPVASHVAASITLTSTTGPHLSAPLKTASSPLPSPTFLLMASLLQL